MTKRLTISIISIIVIISILLSGCSLTKSEKIIPEDREVESIDLLVFNEDKESVKHTLGDIDKDELVEMFNNLGYIDRYIKEVDLTKTLSSEEFEYMLTIHIAKKGLKKAYDYYVYIGRTSTYTALGKEITNNEPKYLKVDTGKKQFKGDATDEIINLLSGIKDNLV